MIRVALIGLGAVARNIHLPAYRQLQDKVSVVAGCDIEDTARAVAKSKWHLSEVYDNAEEMIEKTKPDVVSICTPPQLHHEQCLTALAHGCHVFCEKPFVESLGQADDIIRAGERSQRLVVINNQFPYMKIHTSSKRLIGSPQFGRLLFLHAWQTVRRTDVTEASWRGSMQRRLGFEFGVHVFELIRFFFEANPIKLFCSMPQPIPDLKSEAINIVSLEFADGRAACVVLNRLSKMPQRYLEMRLDGEHATIHTSLGGELRIEFGLHTVEKRPFFGFHFVKGGKAIFQNGPKSKILAKDEIEPLTSATAVHFGNFAAAIHHGTQPSGTARDNRHTLALVFAAYDSARSGTVVEMAQYLK
jgi:D-apiose dehydrogenase